MAAVIRRARDLEGAPGKPEQEFQYNWWCKKNNWWCKKMLALQGVVQEALESEATPIRVNLHLRLGHRKIHDDTRSTP